jgi:NAD(P)-dependent dehydrogenase (short-subunit alcohol dehydrogenase family)
MGSLKNKTVIVTGAGRGMGRAIAVRFGQEGARVLIADVRDKQGEETARLVKEAGGQGLFVHTDITALAQVKAMVAQALEGFGTIDILVNVAGVAVFRDFFEATEEDWDLQNDVNAKGVFLTSQAVAWHMKDRGGGKIVIISSISGHVADPELVPYCASKAAASMLTKAMAAALAPYKINVNAVLPGTVLTDMNRDRLTADTKLREAIVGATPLGRLGNPEDILGAVLYLASDEAPWTTGAILPVDGGYTAL